MNQRPEISSTQKNGSIEIDVVIYPEDHCWIAQGLQFDITARGQTPIEAADNFIKSVGAELVMSFELEDSFPLAGVGSAPQKFWQLYKQAEMRVEKEVSPIGLPEFAAAPHIVPRLRISDKRLVAA
ncbi:MAG: hypothetical protein AB7P20_05625 [Rhizobiaceae bacterium]